MPATAVTSLNSRTSPSTSVPWRLVGIGAVLLVVLGVLVVAVGIPEVRESNRSADEREQAADDARLEARLDRLERVLRAHRSRGTPAATVEERRALVGRLEAVILDDVRARVRAGEEGLEGRIRRGDCQPGRRSGA